MSEPTPRPGDPIPPPANDQRTFVRGPGASPPGDGLQEGPTIADLPPRAPAAPPAPLSRLGDYELLLEVGRGGMGVVFKARHLRLGRVVALKMILGGALARAEDLQRFETEAAAAAQLQHPGIVALYEVGAVQGQPFFSMEFITGSSLSERLALGPVPGRRAASHLEAVARAVHYAHSRGVVHRDLKPGNVLLDEQDQPKVTDFGLAKLMTTDSGQTRTGAVLGTPSYMSPEQAAGRKDVGPASDIYSLGAILYELLTGRPPFSGETPLATLNLVAEKEPVAPRLLNPAVDVDLETICLKCLEKDPARRYVTAEALADDLRRYLDGDPISARPVGAMTRAVKWGRRNPAWATVIAVVCLALGFAVGLAWLTAREERELREKAEEAGHLAQIRFETMRHLLYLAEVRRAQQALESADLGRLERLLGHWEPREGLSDLRDWEWFFLRQQARGRLRQSLFTGRASAVAYHPDGRQLAAAGGALGQPGEIRVWSVRSGAVVRTLKGHADRVTSLAFHPERNLLASASDDKTVRVWDLDKGEAIHVLKGHAAHVTGASFSPDGRVLASAAGDGTIRVWELTSPDQPRVLKGHAGEVTSVAFRPDGTRLASSGRDRTVRVWDVASGKVVRELRGHQGEVSRVAYSHDGKLLASGGGQGNRRGELHVWDADTGAPRFSRTGLAQRLLAVDFAPDGKLAASGSDGVVRLWGASLSSEALTFRADTQVVFDLAFSPDGTSLASAGLGGRVGLWNSSGGLESLTLTAAGHVSAVAFNPVARFLAATSKRDGEVRVWNLDFPERPITYRGHAGGALALAFDGDGHLLATGGEDRTVRLIDVRSPDGTPAVLEGHGGPVSALAFHPGGKLLATASSAEDAIRLWDPASPQAPARTLQAQTNGVQALAIDREGRWLAASGFGDEIEVFDLETGARAFTLRGHEGWVNTLAFSPDGTQLASGGNDRGVVVWDLGARDRPVRLEGSTAPVLSVAWHPGGRRVVSVGEDRTVRVWDVITKQEILELDDAAGGPGCVAFSGDGRYLAAGGNGVVRVWEAIKDPAARPDRAKEGPPP